MEYLLLVFIHVACGVLWAGGAIAAGFFIIPSVLEAGPAGGAVMAGVAKRRFPLVMTAASLLVLLTGVRMYWVRFTADWLTSPEGVVLTVGAILALGALVLGVFVQKPTVERMGALAGQIAASGQPPAAEQAGELQQLRERLGKIGRLTAWHLVGATLLMALHRAASIL